MSAFTYVPPNVNRPQNMDASPLTNALLELNRNSYRAEAVRQEQERLAMQTEKFGWERGDEEAKRAAAAELAKDPNGWEAARRKATAGGSLGTASSLYGMENTATALENARRYRDETSADYGTLPGNAARARPGGAPTPSPATTSNPLPKPSDTPGTPDVFGEGGIGRRLSAKTADFFKTHILDPSLDPAVAEQRYKAFASQPDLAPHFEAGGYGKGDWKSEAQHVYDDAAARATGAAPPPSYAAPTPAPQGAPAAPGAPAATPRPGPASADRDAIIRTVAAEARGEGEPGWQAVTSVIMNRAKASGLSPSQVVMAPGQFEGTKAPLFSQLKPGDPLYERIGASVDGVLSGQATDPTGGATHFFAPKLQQQLGRPVPDWAQGPGQDIGNQRFFNVGYKAPGGMPAGAPMGAAPGQPTGSAPTGAATPAGAPGSADPLTQNMLQRGRSLSQPSAPNASAPAQQPQPSDIALAMMKQDEAQITRALKYGQPVPKAIEDRLAEARKSGKYFVPNVGEVLLPGHAQNVGELKRTEENATGRAKYYDQIYTGLTGSATIAAAQKQNIGIIRTIMDQGETGFGTGEGIQQGTLRLMATLGIKPEAAANREVFNQTMSRVLADQFSGLKSMSSMTGENAPRVFKSMLDIEEKAIATAGDSPEGIRRKIDILDHSGNLMMHWGNLADQYAQAHGGQLDAGFDMAIRAEMARSRIPGYEGTPKAVGDGAGQTGQGQTQQGEKPQTSAGWTPDDLKTAKPGTLTPNGKYVVGTDGLLHPIDVAAPPGAPSATPQDRIQRAQLSPAERMQMRRQESAAAPAQAAAQTASAQQQFDAEAGKLQPIDMLRKYDGMRGQLRPDQLIALNQMLSSIGRR